MPNTVGITATLGLVIHAAGTCGGPTLLEQGRPGHKALKLFFFLCDSACDPFAV